VRDEASRACLNRYERLLMQLSRHELGDHADFINDSSFRLKTLPFPIQAMLSLWVCMSCPAAPARLIYTA